MNESGQCKLCERHADTIKELLEALELLLDAVEGARPLTVGDCNQARSAIAKARGEVK